MSDAQQKALEETSKVALDAADAATRAAEEIHSVKKEYEGLLKSNRGVLRGLSIALVSAAVGLLVAVGASALVYYKSRAQFEKSDEMLLLQTRTCRIMRYFRCGNILTNITLHPKI